LKRSPLTVAIALIFLISFFCTCFAWAVYLVGEYQKSKVAKPETAHEEELHREAQKNTDMLKMALIIILAIVIGGLALLWIITNLLTFEITFSGSLIVSFLI
jgi:hypothetical protein